MSEETPGTGTSTPFAGGEQAQQQQQLQIFVDERDLRTVFCNFYQVHTTLEEVIIDVGYNMPNPRPVPQQAGQAQQAQALLKVHDRVVMSYPTVKRLAASLTQLVKRYEQQFGEISTQPGQRR
jgi:hypothetical protein